MGKSIVRGFINKARGITGIEMKEKAFTEVADDPVEQQEIYTQTIADRQEERAAAKAVASSDGWEQIDALTKNKRKVKSTEDQYQG